MNQLLCIASACSILQVLQAGVVSNVYDCHKRSYMLDRLVTWAEVAMRSHAKRDFRYHTLLSGTIMVQCVASPGPGFLQANAARTGKQSGDVNGRQLRVPG